MKTFVNARPDMLDQLMGAALGRVVEHFGVDQGTLVRFSPGVETVEVLHRVGPVKQLQSPPLAVCDWYADQLRQGRALVLRSLPDDLPLEAAPERELAGRLGMLSHLAIPLEAHGRIWGGIALTAIKERRAWDGEAADRLRLLGEILIDAVLRREAEDAAARQRDELAHVARVAALGELTAALAHELNQPLAAIKTNAEAIQLFLAQGRTPDTMDAILKDIADDATRGGDLIRRLRDLLRRRQLEKVPLDINLAL